MAKKITLLIVVGLFVFMSASCSLVRLGYNNGEILTYWWLDSYVDFDATQKSWFTERIENWFDWHRKTQTNDYVSLLTQYQQRLQHKVTQAELLIENERLKARTKVLLVHALPELADLALSLQPSQIEHIEKKHASNNDTYRKDYLRGDLEQRRQYRFEKVMEQAEYWFGSFSDEQEALIRKASDARLMNNELRMAVRVKSQQDLIRLLKTIQSEKPNRDVVMAMLREHLRNTFEHYGGVENKAFFDTSREETAGLTVVLINCTTLQQKEHAIKRLQQWIDTFRAASVRAV